jgi:Uncharacterized protein conserved in bacteria (DUF2169)
MRRLVPRESSGTFAGVATRADAPPTCNCVGARGSHAGAVSSANSDIHGRAKTPIGDVYRARSQLSGDIASVALILSGRSAMLQVNNHTPFKTAMAAFPNGHAVDTLYVVVKATFTLFPRLALAEVQAPLALMDEYFGDPGASSIKYASELHIGNGGTDVILFGPRLRLWPSSVGECCSGEGGGAKKSRSRVGESPLAHRRFQSAGTV